MQNWIFRESLTLTICITKQYIQAIECIFNTLQHTQGKTKTNRERETESEKERGQKKEQLNIIISCLCEREKERETERGRAGRGTTQHNYKLLM